MLAEQVREWTEEWVEEGREQGIAQGREQGIAQGRAEERALLCRLAERKFDAATARRLAAALEDVANAGRLAEVGDWIIECGTAADLLARVSDERLDGRASLHAADEVNRALGAGGGARGSIGRLHCMPAPCWHPRACGRASAPCARRRILAAASGATRGRSFANTRIGWSIGNRRSVFGRLSETAIDPPGRGPR